MDHLPLRLIPLFGETGNNRQLRLELQFNPNDFPYLLRANPGNHKDGEVFLPEQLITLEEVQVDLDAEDFGKPISEGLISEFRFVVNAKEKFFYRVTWRGMWFQAGEEVTRIKLPLIRFSQAIQPDAKLSGSLRIRVPALLSGIKRVSYFSGLGNPVGDSEQTGQPYPFLGSTVIHLTYDLALEKLRRTWWISLPKGQIPADLAGAKELKQSAQWKFPVPLEPETIRNLLSELGESGGGGDAHIETQYTSLRRVVQNPPRTSEQDARRNRWYWDVKGRRFKDSLPIDFHLIVTGEDIGDSAGNRDGFTEVEITVQGQVFECYGIDPHSMDGGLTHNLGDLEDELRILEDQVKSVFSSKTNHKERE